MKSFAVLFPGQGSQSVGMLAELAETHATVSATFDDASELLGYDLWKIVQDGPESRLNQTEVTQPAMLAAGVATWRIWRELGGAEPEILAGHSLGDYCALVASGQMAFRDAVQVVAARGRFMQQAVPEGTGAMAAILGLDSEPLEAICERLSDDEHVVSCANFNAPGQIVIAGDADSVEAASQAALEAGAKRAVPLPVSVPSHCELMKPAADELAEVLDTVEFQPAGIAVLHNADVRQHSGNRALRDVLCRQLWQPVRWSDTIRQMRTMGIDHFVECGPGRVLAGLNRRNARDAETVAWTDDASIRQSLEQWGES